MNVSTNNITFKGLYLQKDNNGEVKEQSFTNDKEVLETLGKTLQSGVLTKAEITKQSYGVPCLKASLTVNDVLEIWTEKANVKEDGFSVIVRTKDENGEKRIRIDDKTFGKNTALYEQLLTFINLVGEKVKQAKEEAQNAINNQVIDLLSSKKSQLHKNPEIIRLKSSIE